MLQSRRLDSDELRRVIDLGTLNRGQKLLKLRFRLEQSPPSARLYGFGFISGGA
jgi:hypothetical protein